LRIQQTVGAAMTTPAKEELPFSHVQTDDEKAETMRKATAEATAARLKATFTEARNTENPEEAGCVAWYRFPEAGK
jgi:hypothetical protein